MRIEQGELPISRGNYPTTANGTMISPGEWGLGRRTFLAIGISTGIVVAAHNSDTGDGLLGHFLHIAPEGHDDDRIADEGAQTVAFAGALSMIKRLGPPGETEIWVGGGADYAGASQEIDLTIKGDRQHAQRLLQQVMLDGTIPISRLQTRWSRGQEDLIIELNSQNGVLLVSYLENSP